MNFKSESDVKEAIEMVRGLPYVVSVSEPAWREHDKHYHAVMKYMEAEDEDKMLGIIDTKLDSFRCRK